MLFRRSGACDAEWMQISELARRGERLVGAEARLGVADVIERRVLVVALALEHLEQVVLRVALGGYAPRVAHEAPQLRGRDELTVACTGRGRDGFVDQRAAEIVGASGEEDLRELRPFLDPRGLDVAER